MYNKLFDLKGKTILITGGAGFLGEAMSEAVAEFGADLFITGIDLDKAKHKVLEIRKKYNSSICEAFKLDMSNQKMINDVIDLIVRKTNKIDVLINNAYYGTTHRLEDYTKDEWEKGISGTINGVFYVTQSVLKYMQRQKHGNIINIASMYGMVAPDASIYDDNNEVNPVSYGVGKAGIIQFTKYIAAVYAKEGIRSNSISPGPFPNTDKVKSEEFLENLRKKNPMNRLGIPEDLKGIVVLLASDASSYINGQNIAVDGGWTIW